MSPKIYNLDEIDVSKLPLPITSLHILLKPFYYYA